MYLSVMENLLFLLKHHQQQTPPTATHPTLNKYAMLEHIKIGDP